MRLMMKRQNKIIFAQILLLFIVLFFWQLKVGTSPKLLFLYSSPVEIISTLWHDTINLVLPTHSLITLSELIGGFFVGNILGIICGLSLWYFKTFFKILYPYLTIISALPIFMFAPIMVIWFGIGMMSKFVLVFISVFILTLMHSFQGAERVDKEKLKMMNSFGANRLQLFYKLILPSSLSYVFSALSASVGAALIAVFIGEFISSTAGLGYYIIISSGVYNISGIFAGMVYISAIALLLNQGILFLKKKFMKWE